MDNHQSIFMQGSIKSLSKISSQGGGLSGVILQPMRVFKRQVYIRKETEAETLRNRVRELEEHNTTLRSHINQLQSHKHECESKQEEIELLSQQLKILDNECQLARDSLKVKEIFQREMEGYSRMRTELESLRLENERLRPQCGRILVLQEKLEQLECENRRLEDRNAALLSQQSLNLSTNVPNVESSVAVDATILRLTNTLKEKNDLVVECRTSVELERRRVEEAERALEMKSIEAARYKTKLGDYKDRYLKLQHEHESYLKENLCYKQVLDKVVQIQSDDKTSKMYQVVEEAYNRKLRTFQEELAQLKPKHTNISENASSISNKNDSNDGVVLSMVTSPLQLHLNNTQRKLNEAYKHNRLLVNSLKMSKKLTYWKEKNLLPKAFIEDVRKLPTTQRFHELQEKYLQTEKLLENIKLACSEKVVQLKKDIIQILGYNVEFNDEMGADDAVKLLSVYAPSKTDSLLFIRDEGDSYRLKTNEMGLTHSTLINNLLCKFNNDPNFTSSSWPILTSYLTMELSRIGSLKHA